MSLPCTQKAPAVARADNARPPAMTGALAHRAFRRIDLLCHQDIQQAHAGGCNGQQVVLVGALAPVWPLIRVRLDTPLNTPKSG